MNKEYTFVLKDQQFTAPVDLNFLNKVGTKISNQLLNSEKYIVESNVQPQNFQTFLSYLMSNSGNLEINSANYSDYCFLNEEFNHIISDIISRPEYDKYREGTILDILISRENADNSALEKQVAINLDYYLTNYSRKMSQIQFNSLYNIFNNEDRNLSDHERAYQFIIQNIEQSENDRSKKSFCILLGSLDAVKMKEKSVNEAIMKRDEHFGFIPKSNDSFICSVNKSLNEMKNQIDDKFDQLLTVMVNQQKITQDFEARMKSLENKFDLILTKINEMARQTTNENQQNEINSNLQNLQTKVNLIQSNLQVVSQKVENINDCTQLHFKLEHDNFNGIIRHLTQQCGGNVHDKNEVIVTSSSCSNSRLAKYAVDLDDNVHYFCSESQPNSWFQYDFRNKVVCPTHYSIRSCNDYGKKDCNLMSWVIEGSNDENDWTVLDYRKQVDDLDDFNAAKTFQIQKQTNKFFRYLRIRSTGHDSNGYDYMLFSALEFFGSIK